MAERASEARPLILGTAGHIDHGKTRLVEALTGTNTDRLEEERRRGISIELGFAELRLPSGRVLGVVDVPGHERLVRTMVAGATGIDLFLLVVAADEGVMPQTREHLTVLEALGISTGVIALTRCDLAEAPERRAAASAAAELVPGAPLVEVSAPTGAGLDALRGALDDAAGRIDAERATTPGWPPTAPVLHVDRAFSLRGVGTVVTGTLASGELAAGDGVEILPARHAARIRGIEVHGRSRARAGAGQRVALNLAGVRRDEVGRGDTLTAPDAGLRPTYRLDAQLRLRDEAGELAGQRIHVHHGTRDVPARVVALRPGLAQLRLEAPLVARAGDSIVIRRIAPADTLGGGQVIDPAPPRHSGGTGSAHLDLLLRGEPEELVARALSAAGPMPSDPERWTAVPLLAPALARFGRSRWEEAISSLVAAGRAGLREGRLEPPRPRRAPPPQPAPVEARDHEALGLLAADGLQPRAPQALAEALAVSREAAIASLERLVAAGLATRVKPGVYYDSDALQAAAARIVELARKRGAVTLPELRDTLGTSRKYAQALLEWLDAQKLTVRHGDRHVLRRGV